jgi:hypothetical protein
MAADGPRFTVDAKSAKGFRFAVLRVLCASVVNDFVRIAMNPMVEELEQEYSALREKVHDLQEYL